VTVLWAILGVVAVVLFLVVVLVATPVHLRLVAEAGERFKFRTEVMAFWGLGPKLTFRSGQGMGEADLDIAAPPRRPKKRGKPHRKRRQAIEPGQAFRLLTSLPDAVLTGLGRIHFDRVNLEAVFGFDDPAETGEFFGRLTPFVYGLPQDRCDVCLRPDFDRARFEGSAEVALHATPLMLVWPIIRLFLHVRTARP
jgi:hypothetical protein